MKSTRTKSKLYLDSGCSRHMTGDKSQFTSLEARNRGNVTFGKNEKGKIVGIGNIGNTQTLSIHHVLLADSLKHNGGCDPQTHGVVQVVKNYQSHRELKLIIELLFVFICLDSPIALLLNIKLN